MFPAVIIPRKLGELVNVPEATQTFDPSVVKTNIPFTVSAALPKLIKANPDVNDVVDTVDAGTKVVSVFTYPDVVTLPDPI